MEPFNYMSLGDVASGAISDTFAPSWCAGENKTIERTTYNEETYFNLRANGPRFAL
jgi:hypothetical protein